MQAGAISKLLYGFASVWAIIHSLKLVDYLLVRTHKPYNNFCLSYDVAPGSELTPCIKIDKPLVA